MGVTSFWQNPCVKSYAHSLFLSMRTVMSGNSLGILLTHCIHKANFLLTLMQIFLIFIS